MRAAIRQDENWLSELRATGAATFEYTGLPTQKNEAWKYTSLVALKKFNFAPVNVSDAKNISFALDESAYRLVFVNGIYQPKLSNLHTLPKGVRLTSLEHALRNPELADIVSTHLGQLVDAENKALVALNTSYVQDGTVLVLERGAVLDRPLEIVISGSTDSSYPRNLIILEENAQAVILENYQGEGAYFTNTVSEIFVNGGAQLTHCRLQQDSDQAINISNTAARVMRDGVYDNFSLSIGASLSRNEIHTRLEGKGAACHLNGAYLMGGAQHCDNTTLIEHIAPNCQSNQTYKGVLAEKSRGVFQGKIHVHQAAQKTDGYQMNQALLLSPHAEIDSKPELEIYADDVKCSHGATVGQIDENALFYLRSRGIPVTEANALLIKAFVDDAVDKIKNEAIREVFMNKIAERLVCGEAK